VRLTGTNALGTSPGCSIVLDVRRSGDGPAVDLARWGWCGIPSTGRSPTTRCPGGNIPPDRWSSLPPGHRVVALGRLTECHTPAPLPGLTLVSAIPETAGVRGGERPQFVPFNLIRLAPVHGPAI
jgi:hypothetical protein